MIYKRKSPRLHNYDYSQNGAYFVTICSKGKKQVFWDDCTTIPFDRPKPILSRLGTIADNTIKALSEKYNICVDKYVIMPNHIHMIIVINENGTAPRAAPTCSLSQIVGAYKSLIASEWLKCCKKENVVMGEIWQRSYYEHVIRSDDEYLSIWQYIDDNPAKWTEDEYYPANI